MRAARLVAALLLALVGAAVLWAVLSREETAGSGGPGRTGAGMSGAGTAAVAWTGSVEIDSGPGRVGPWRMNRSDWRYVDDPTVALDDRGGAAVAWVDQARKDVLFQRRDAGGGPAFPSPVNVSRTPEVFSWLPRVAVDGDRVYLLWQEIVFSGGTHGGEAFFARSTDGGRSFSEPVNLSNTPAGAGKGRLTPELWHNGSLDLATGPRGELVAAWTVYEGGLFVARSGDGGRSFSEPVRVSSAGGGAEPARAPSLAVAAGGAVHLAWAVGGDPAADLRHAASADGGRSFGAPRALFPGPGHADAPALAAGPDGSLHLAWAESPEGAGGAYRIRYARAEAGGDVEFGAPRTVAAPEGEELAGFRFPSLALDGRGNPVLLWELYPRGSERPRGLGVAASRDGGSSFGRPGLVPGTADGSYAVNGSLQGLLMRKLAVGDAGDVAVVNSAFEPGEASRVRLVRGRLAGEDG